MCSSVGDGLGRWGTFSGFRCAMRRDTATTARNCQDDKKRRERLCYKTESSKFKAA
jgi:hypothetical protein